MSILLNLLSLIGLCFFGRVIGKLHCSLCPLWVSALCILFLYIFALFGLLEVAANTLFALGLIFFVLFSFRIFCNVNRQEVTFWALFIALLALSWLYVAGMAFSVSDDYVYWGAVSKYLFLKKSLLSAGHPLYYKHETYTPALALLHFFFLRGQEAFSERIIFFAQDWLLVSCVIALLKEQRLSQLNLMLLLVLACTLFFGSVFAKLSVDYFLSLLTFLLLWLNWHEDDPKQQWLFTLPCILLLFLVKQVGLVLAFFVLLCIFFQNVRSKTSRLQIIMVAACLFSLLILKFSWSAYCQSQNFQSFASLSLKDVVTLLSFWKKPLLAARWGDFFKSVLVLPIDRLNTPFIAWLMMLVGTSFYLCKQLPPLRAKQFQRFIMIFLIALLAYIISLGVFELHAFVDLRKPTSEFPGLARYLSLFFCGGLFFVLLLASERLAETKPGLIKPSFFLLVIGVVLLVVVGRGKRLQEDYAKENRAVLLNLQRTFKPIKNSRPKTICLLKGPFDLVLSYEAIYALLPDYQVRLVADFKKPQLTGCDQVLSRKGAKALARSL
jgi:hypothetical protein